MHTAKRPYWVWSLDRWNLLVAGLLVVTLLLLNSSGLGLPAEVSQPLAATPAFVAPAEDAALLAGQPGEMTGTAAPNARVRVSDGDVPLGETTADANGRWQLAVPALAPGAHTLTAQVTDADGNVIATSEPLAITVREPGMTAPVAAAPVIKLPQGELKAGTPLTLEGTGTPNSTVTLYDGDRVVAETVVAPDGTWKLTLPPLSEGAHRLIAKWLGADGKEQAASAPVELTVADGQVVVAIPAAPTPAASVAAAPGIKLPAGELKAGAPLTLEGTGTPGTTVTVYDGDQVVGQTTVGPDGTWNLTVSPLALGAHRLIARLLGADGKEQAVSAPVELTVADGQVVVVTPAASTPAASTPAAPTPGTTAPVAAAPGIKLPQGELKAGTPLTLEGTGTPGSTVTVYDGDQVVGQTTVGPDGTWNLTVSPLALGAHRLIARLLGADGKEQAVSAPVELTVADGQVVVATTAPSEMPAATVEPTVEGGSGGVTAAATSTVGVPAASGTPVATAAVAASVPAVIAPAGGAVQADAPLDLEGTGAPGSTVKVYEGNQLLGEAIVGADGKWKTTLPALAAGAHALIAKLFGADGKLLATSEPLAITVPEVSVAILPVINPLAAEKSATEAPTTLTGTAAPGTLLKLYDGAKLLGEATADASGNWKLTVPRLAAGEHILTAIAYGAGGEVQALSKPLTVIVPEAQPAAGGKTATQSKIGWPPDGSTVVSSRPLMTGRSFPRGVVRVYDGETLLGETIADANGFWSFRPSVALSAGQHVLTAVATSADGQTTEKAPPVTITVRGRTVTLPSWKPLVGATPTFLTPANGDTVNTVQPLFAGTAAPNSSIRLYDGDKVIGEVTVDSDGRWTFRPTAPLSEGEHTITVTLLNADGTESPSKSTVTLTVASGLGTAPATAPLVINALPAATSNSRPALTGQAPSGATVRIYDGDMLLGEVKADPSGVWYFVPAAPLAAGEHVLRFEVVGPDGSKLASADRTLTVNAGATAVTPPKIVAPTLGQAAPGDMLSGTAPAGSQVQIYDGGKLIGGATAGANGKWRFRLPRKLAAGKHEIHVVAVDQSGSPVSQSVIVTIEVSPPRTLPVTGAGSTGA